MTPPTRPCPHCGKPVPMPMLHPVQALILTHLYSVEDASPKEIAQATDEKLGDVAYHVRTLAAHGVLRRTRTVPRRGAVENFYEVAL